MLQRVRHDLATEQQQQQQQLYIRRNWKKKDNLSLNK